MGTRYGNARARRWGLQARYEAYFNLRWLGGIAEDKCGTSWLDSYGTTRPDFWELMDMPRSRLRDIRPLLLRPLGVEFGAPTRVALYLYGPDLAVIENFNNVPVDVSLSLNAEAKPHLSSAIPQQPVRLEAKCGTGSVKLPPPTLVALSF